VPSWTQDPITGKLIPRDEYERPRLNDAPAVQGDIEAFVSPVDGQIIDDRGKLRRHNKQHGCTNSRDYTKEWSEKRRASIDREGQRDLKQSRIKDIQAAIMQIRG
jgi:hypothetical protein